MQRKHLTVEFLQLSQLQFSISARTESLHFILFRLFALEIILKSCLFYCLRELAARGEKTKKMKWTSSYKSITWRRKKKKKSVIGMDKITDWQSFCFYFFFFFNGEMETLKSRLCVYPFFFSSWINVEKNVLLHTWKKKCLEYFSKFSFLSFFLFFFWYLGWKLH